MKERKYLWAWAESRDAVRRPVPVRPQLEALEERWTPSGFGVQPSFTSNEILAVSGSGPNDVFAVGVGGTILHSTGRNGPSLDLFAPQSSGTTEALNGVWGSSSTNVFAVGANGTILHSTNDGSS